MRTPMNDGPRVSRRSRFAAAIAVLLALALLAVNEVGDWRAREVIEDRDHQLEARAEVVRLLRVILSAESGQRGYLLTGRAQYKEPYTVATVAFEETLARIHTLFANEPVRLAEARQLEELARQKMSELATTIELFEQGKEEAWRDLMLTDIGREKMAQLDELSRAMARREGDRLDRAQKVLDDTLRNKRIGIAALVLLSLAALLAFMRQAQRLSVERAERAAALSAERDRLEAEVERRTRELRDIATHLQTAREDERQRLARELHDELGGLLTAAKLDVARIRNKLAGSAPEISERFSHLVQSLDAGIALKRRIIEDLHPSSLSHLGLKPALDILCQEFAKRSDIAVVTEIDDLPLAPATRLTAYRVVQEALTNIAKYAAARSVHVGLHAEDGRARLDIRDDGVGFDPDATPASAHGLAGMRFRVASDSGELAIESRPGSGTRIVAHLPLADAGATADERL